MTPLKPIVCIATGTRADWGLLLPVANELRARGNVDVRILATNMHLLADYGNTLDEVNCAGFGPATLVPIYPDSDKAEPTDSLSRAVAMGDVLKAPPKPSRA